MSTKIVVVGAGPGGYTAAARAAQLGAEVVLIEADALGGTCLNRGCIPSKIMISSADLLEKIKNAETFAIKTEGRARCDITELMKRKRAIVQTQTKGIESLLKRRGVKLVKGEGFVKGPGMAAVRAESGKITELPYDRLILACGTRPMDIPALPFDGGRILSSDHALSLETLPQSLLIIGGGVIGCEFAFIMSALGVEATLVEAMPRLLPLPSLDEDFSKILQREMKKRKIRFFVGKTAEIDQSGDKLKVLLKPSPWTKNPSEKDKKPATLEVDKALACVGRKPALDALKLENIGIVRDSQGWLKVNEKMETEIPGVHAVGDILGPSKIMLAHVASAEGLTAAENAVGRNRIMDYSSAPFAVFTSPEIACVGLSEKQAEERGRKTRADNVLFRGLGKAQADGEISGQAKIVSETDEGKILGVQIIGPRATELIAEACLAIKMGAKVEDLAQTIHAHPTFSEIMTETAFKALDCPLHG